MAKNKKLKKTESRNNNAGLYASDLLQHMLDAIPQPIYYKDRDGKYRGCNVAFEKVVGLPKNKIIGKTAYNVMSSDVDVALNEIGKELFEHPGAKEYESRVVFADGSKHDVIFHKASLTAYRGIVSGVVGTLFDITDRKRTESELARFASFPLLDPSPIIEIDEAGMITYLNPAARMRFPNLMTTGYQYPLFDDPPSIIKDIKSSSEEYIVRDAEFFGRIFEQSIYFVPEIGRLRVYLRDVTDRRRMDQLKNDFVGTVSHELRTPLSITKEGINIVLEGLVGVVSDQQRHFLTSANDNIDRLTRIINDLLDISKIESGSLVLRREMTDINEFVRNVLGVFRSKLEDKNLELKLDIPSKKMWAYIDRDKMTQVLINLIGNAVKFTQKGYLKVSLLENDEEIICYVEDTGEGIAKENIGGLFNKFKQFGRINGPGEKGTGLGLAIARGFVEMHDGKIWAESKKGKGSVFFFSLPKYSPEEMLSKHVIQGIKNAIVRESGVALLIITFLGLSAHQDGFRKEKIKKAKDGILAAIKAELKGSDDVAMELSEEIAVILGDCDLRCAISVTKRLWKKVIAVISREGLSENFTPLFGFSSYPESAKNDKEMILNARNSAKPLQYADEKKFKKYMDSVIRLGKAKQGDRKYAGKKTNTHR